MLLAALCCSGAMGRPSLVTFTLIKGGPEEGAYETFVHSRQCLESAIPADVEYTDVAFHEGNVPSRIQHALRQTM